MCSTITSWFYPNPQRKSRRCGKIIYLLPNDTRLPSISAPATKTIGTTVVNTPTVIDPTVATSPVAVPPITAYCAAAYALPA